MEDQIIVFELPDGSIRYSTCPAGSKKPGETTPEWLLRIFNKTVRGNYPGATRILNAVMPDGQPFVPGAKKLFYGAWKHAGGGSIEIDMPAARAIRMEEIRAERDRLLDESDREWARLADIGTPEQRAACKSYRQALRDIPQNTSLEGIGTPEMLAPSVPDWPAYPDV